MLCNFYLFIMFISLIIINNFEQFQLMKYSQYEMLSYQILLRNYQLFVLILHSIDLVYLIQEFILLIKIIFLMKILIDLFHQYQEDNFLSLLVNTLQDVNDNICQRSKMNRFSLIFTYTLKEIIIECLNYKIYSIRYYNHLQIKYIIFYGFYLFNLYLNL